MPDPGTTVHEASLNGGRPPTPGAWPSDAVVVLTGASSGLGKELFVQLSRAGADVRLILHPRHRGMSPGQSGHTNQAASLTFCDLADPGAVADAAQGIAARTPRLNTLILCAGTAAYGSIVDVPWSVVRHVMDVDYLANVILVQALLPTLKAQPAARIVGIGSGSALFGLRRGSAYTAAKAAFRNFFEALQAECTGSSVKVLHVIPGYMQTPLHTKQPRYPLDRVVPPTGRPVDVRTVAKAVLRVAKDRQGELRLGRNPRLAYHLRYWCPSVLHTVVRRHGY